jgi:hypothetical protein
VEFFDPTVATLRRGGSATLLGAGTAAIAASMGGQKASTVLTVTVAVSPVFTAQPVNTNVSAVIDAGGVKVQWLDNVVGPFFTKTGRDAPGIRCWTIPKAGSDLMQRP